MSRIAMVVHALYATDPRIRRQADALIRGGHRVDIFCPRGAGQGAEERGDRLRIVERLVAR